VGEVMKWTVAQLADLAGKTYLITGGNAGIGYEAAAHLRRANANVIISSRSPVRGNGAISHLRDLPGDGTVDQIRLNLASIDSIFLANDAIRLQTDGLDAIINNAGVMQTPEKKTVDGFELQFGTNHLGHFLLNYLMFDLVSVRSGRIVPVSSIAHKRSKGIRVDDPMFSKRYSPSKAYAHSKLANLVYGMELARRLHAAGSSVIAASAHPGYAATNLQSSGPTGFFKQFYKITNRLVAQSASDGALPEVLAAAGPGVSNGDYYGPTRLFGMRGAVGEVKVSSDVKDADAGANLWSLSEELLDITWDLD